VVRRGASADPAAQLPPPLVTVVRAGTAPCLLSERWFPLGGGKYRVTTEEILTEEQLAAMGLELPPLDLPWKQETPRVVHAAERTEGLRYWAKHLGGYDQRLSSRVVVFIQEFGLEGVKQAIDQVAATNPTVVRPRSTSSWFASSSKFARGGRDADDLRPCPGATGCW
jgi:hypothetical protein